MLLAVQAPSLAELGPALGPYWKRSTEEPERSIKGSRIAKASEIAEWAEAQGWTARQTPNGPLKFIDENGFFGNYQDGIREHRAVIFRTSSYGMRRSKSGFLRKRCDQNVPEQSHSDTVGLVEEDHKTNGACAY